MLAANGGSRLTGDRAASRFALARLHVHSLHLGPANERDRLGWSSTPDTDTLFAFACSFDGEPAGGCMESDSTPIATIGVVHRRHARAASAPPVGRELAYIEARLSLSCPVLSCPPAARRVTGDC